MTNNTSSQRDIVRRTAVVAMAVGMLMVVAALPQLLMRMFGVMPRELPGTLPPPLDIFSLVWRHGVLLSSLQIAMGVLLVAAGKHLLHRHPWARAAVEVAAWVALNGYVCIGAFWLYGWAHLHPEPSTLWTVPFAAIGLVVLLFWSIVFAAVIRFLRSRRFRRAMTNGQQTA